VIPNGCRTASPQARGAEISAPANFQRCRTTGRARHLGPCAFLDPRGRLVPKELARLETIIHGYEAQLAAGRKRIPRCTYDGGAFGRQVDKNEQITEDLNHLSIKGAAEAAAVAWAAMKRGGVIPR
jgi:hypothetical protein